MAKFSDDKVLLFSANNVFMNVHYHHYYAPRREKKISTLVVLI